MSLHATILLEEEEVCVQGAVKGGNALRTPLASTPQSPTCIIWPFIQLMLNIQGIRRHWHAVPRVAHCGSCLDLRQA